MLGDQRPFFLQLVQQNNCIVFCCQKRTGWNKIVELGTATDTQGLDYASERRHNCVKGRTADVKERLKKKKIEKKAQMSNICHLLQTAVLKSDVFAN